MTEWAAKARTACAERPAALVSILATEGSAPRGAGTRMVVTDGGIAGTIGGGTLEYRAIEQARAILALPPGSWRIQDYPLGPLLGQCCGGRVRLLVEHLDPDALAWLDAPPDRTVLTRLTDTCVQRMPTDRSPTSLAARNDRPRAGDTFVERSSLPSQPVYLFGAGHVGKAIARVLHGLPFSLAWFDSRAEMDAVGITIVPDDDLPRCVADAPAGSAVIILTHDHALDYRLTAAALAGRAAFIGLIGSATKRARFLSRLAKSGFDDEARARLVCPIGLPGIPGNEPEAIAIAVVAQLLRLRTGDQYD